MSLTLSLHFLCSNISRVANLGISARLWLHYEEEEHLRPPYKSFDKPL